MGARVSIALGIVVLLSAVGVFALIVWPREARLACDARDPDLVLAAQERPLDADVRLYGVCREGGDEVARVHLVDGAVAEDPGRAVSQCVSRFASRHPKVLCYAFASDEAFQAAAVALDGSEMDRACWTSYLEQVRGEGARGLTSNPDYEAQGCP